MRARVGAVVFALGLSLAGTQAAGVAFADTDSADTGSRGAATSDEPPRQVGVRGGAVRPPTAVGSTRPGRGASHSQAAAPVTEPRTADEPTEPAPPPAQAAVALNPPPPDTAAAASLVVADVAPIAAPVDTAPPVVPVPAPGTAVRAAPALPGGWSGAPSGQDPSAPVDAPLAWAMLAAARRETFASTPTVVIPQTPRQCQAVEATESVRSLVKTSRGVRNPRIARGRSLSSSAMASR